MRLFELAKERPDGCVLFFDEIDGLCRKRSESEDETTRRVKNELLKQLDGKLACQLCTNEHTYAPHYAQYLHIEQTENSTFDSSATPNTLY